MIHLATCLRNLAFATLIVSVTTACDDRLNRPSETRSSDQQTDSRHQAPATLQCDNAIDTVATPPHGYTVIRGLAALPTSRDNPSAHENQAPADARADLGAPRFFKSGLLVRAGAAFKILVPEAQRETLSISWGHGGTARTWDLTVPACNGTTGWKVFTGGFWVEEEGCFEIIVRDGEHDEVLQFGIGTPCPGQLPPSV